MEHRCANTFRRGVPSGHYSPLDTDWSDDDSTSASESYDNSTSAGESESDDDSTSDSESDDDSTSESSESEDDLNNSFFDERTGAAQPQSTPLYPGAIISIFMTHLLLFQYSMRHSLTKKAMEELLKLISVLVPPGSAVPKSFGALKKFFVENFPELRPSMQHYCSTCHQLLSPQEECQCSTAVSQFINVPLGPQLKARLEGQCVWCACMTTIECAHCSCILSVMPFT